MKRKILLLILLILFILILMVAWDFRFKTYKNEEYGFSFKYRATFMEKYDKDLLIWLRNEAGTMEISAVAKKVEKKTDKTLEESGIGYANLIKALDSEKDVQILSNETIRISKNSVEAQKVFVKVSGKTVAKEVAILIPLDDREITIRIIGGETVIDKNQGEIEKIIESIEI